MERRFFKLSLFQVIALFIAIPNMSLAWPSLNNVIKKGKKTIEKPAEVKRDRINNSPAAVHIRNMESMTRSFKSKLQKNDAWWANVEQNQYWVKSDLKRAKNHVAAIKDKDPSFSTSEYEQIMSQVKARLKKAESAGRAKQDHVNSLRDSAMAFKKELQNLYTLFQLINKLDSGKAKLAEWPKEILKVGDQFNQLAGFLERCKKTYIAAMNDPDPWGQTYWRSVAKKEDRAMCQLQLQQVKAHVLDWVENSIAKADKTSMKAAISYLDDLSKEGKFSEWAVEHFKKIDDEVKKDRAAWQPVFDRVLKRPMPEKLFTGQATYYRDNYPKALKRGIAFNRFNRGRFKGRSIDAKSSMEAKRFFIQSLKMKVLKVQQTGQWTIKKNGIGIPLERFNGTRLLVKAPKESHCRIYEVIVHQPYSGGGTWARSREVSKGQQSDFWVAPCR